MAIDVPLLLVYAFVIARVFGRWERRARVRPESAALPQPGLELAAEQPERTAPAAGVTPGRSAAEHLDNQGVREPVRPY